MGTSVVAETTPTGSLQEAAAAFGKIRSQESEDRVAPKATPEQREDDSARPDAQQAPANVQAASDEETEATEEAAQPQKFRLKNDKGEPEEVTETDILEWRKGHLRQDDYTRKTQALAEERRQVEAAKEAELSSVRAQRQEYTELLGKMKAVVTPVEPDPATLSPDEFHVRYAEYREAKQAVEKIEAEQKRMADLKAKEDAEWAAKHANTEYQKLVEAIPEFGDTEKAEPLRKELAQFAVTIGFTEQDLALVTDHRLVKLLHTAMAGERALKAAKEKAPKIENKIERVLEAIAPGGRQDASPKNEVLKEQERLSKSGRVEDAARVFGAIRKREAARST